MIALRQLPLLLTVLTIVPFVTSCGGGGGNAVGGGSGSAGNSPLAIITSSLSDVLAGQAFSQTLVAAGGTPPYSWSTVGTVPLGLAVSGSGTLSGLPLPVGAYQLSVQVRDSSAPTRSASATLGFTAYPVLSFLTSSLGNGNVGRQYAGFILAPGGSGKVYSWSLQPGSGPLPPGLALTGHDGTGTLSGLPTAPGIFNFVVQVDDPGPPRQTISRAFSLTIDNQLVISSGDSLPTAIVAKSYGATLNAAGGTPPYAWRIESNFSLPPGLQLGSSSGIVSGIPTQLGNFSFMATVTDSGVPQGIDSRVMFLQIYDQVKVATSVLPTVAANAPVKFDLRASGGIGNYTWAQIGGALPPGVLFSPNTATISGQTSAIGAFGLILQVSDAGPPSQTSDPTTLQFTVGASLGRNNSLATATQLSNGTYKASLSPVADPPTGVANPDSDYYSITANPGSFVTVEITAVRLNPPSSLDPVLEFVDSNNSQLSYCASIGDSPPIFARLCVNDDLTDSTDSRLALLVPSNNPGPLTFYAHVLDFRGDARPDFVYTITVSGAN